MHTLIHIRILVKILGSVPPTYMVILKQHTENTIKGKYPQHTKNRKSGESSNNSEPHSSSLLPVSEDQLERWMTTTPERAH